MTNGKRAYQFDWARGTAGIAFWLMETAYFGWNATPKSDAELICDGISLLIWALAWQRIS